MSENFLKKTTIVFIDDNNVISSVFRNFLEELEPLFEVNFKIHTAEDGIEGLGFVFTTNPEIIIIDSSIPKYSGQEVLDFLTSNPSFKGTKVITINDHKSITDSNSLTKSDLNFLGKLFQKISKKFDKEKLTTKQRYKMRFLNGLIWWANLSDRFYSFLSKRNSLVKAFGWFTWLLIQIGLSIHIIIARLILTYKKPERVIPLNLSFLSLRNKSAPSVAVVLSIAFILIFQVSLFTFGGIKLFNSVRIESIFATGNNVERFNFNLSNQSEFDFDANLIEITEAGIALKNISVPNNIPSVPEEPIIDPPQPTQPESYPVEEPTEPSEPEEQQDEPVEAPPLEEPTDVAPDLSEPETLPESYSILGLSDSSTNDETLSLANYQYSTDKPFAITRKPISFSSIKKILELSSINNEETSTEINNIEQTNLSTNITYQISPDGENWYYYSHIDSAWARTEIGYVTSNTIQVLNQNIATLNNLITSKEIYLKIFLVSDGSSTPVLKEIVIEKHDEIVNLIDEPVIEEPAEEEVISKLDFSKLQPYIFNASFVNGNKVVLGKLLLKDKAAKAKYEISEEDLKEFKAQVYFSNTDIATKNSLIGETELYLNQRGEIEFLLIAPSTDGGFITAQILYAPEGVADLPPLPGQTSELASPVENSTFTVDSTGDEIDLSAGNGLCLTSAGTCTLRAAIAEANALAGNDNIYFNIPTSDSGYRDYETPNTASSGDSLGGDDYWTIRPATVLPTITTTIIIDGATQTTNQSDTNTAGPEIEIAGLSLGAGSNGFNITGSGVNVNSIVMNRFESQIQLSANTANNFVVTRSYFGIDVKAATDYTTTQKYGVNVNAVVTGVQIGNTTADGNVFGGFDINGALNEDSGVHLVCGTAVTAQQVVIAGNYFGMNPAGTVALPNFYGIWLRNNCDVVIGGNTSAERNYIGESKQAGISIRPANSTLPNVRVYNNYFGVEATATQYRPNNLDIFIAGGQNYTGAQNPIKIGDVGKGNLLIGATSISILSNSWRAWDISYNSIISHKGIQELSTPAPFSSFNGVNIINNYIARSTSSDPYFGIAANPPAQSSLSQGIFTERNPVIKGNIISGYNNAFVIWATWSNTFQYLGLSQPTLGGTGSFTGSLCNGLEQNCLEDLDSYTFSEIPGAWPAFVQLYSNPIDQAAFIVNNDVSDLNPSDTLISNFWMVAFEVFSGTNRRTDLADNTIDLVLPSNNPMIWYDSSISNYKMGTTIDKRNWSVPCNVPANCPASGATNGVSGRTMAIKYLNGSTFFYTLLFSLQNETLVNGTVVSAPATIKIESNHWASQTFSFDGDSTTHPIVGDRSEPWTNDTLADGDINDGTVGAVQQLEVEYVDANPIWDGSKWVITVDSTTDENNVSTCGFNDGSGAYSGGGCGGTDGLPNGKTSLREAVLVANNFAQPVTINFNIPTTDPNYNTTFPGAFEIPLTDVISPTTTFPLAIDGFSQTLFTGDTNLNVDELPAMPVSGNATTGPEVILSGSNPIMLNRRFISSTSPTLTINSLGFNGAQGRRFIRLNTAGTFTLTDSTFSNGDTGAIETAAVAIDYTITDSIFKNISLTSTGTSAVELRGGTNVTLIENNQFVNIGNDAINIQGGAIPATDLQINNNLFKTINNAVLSNTTAAITFHITFTGGTGIVTGNEFVDIDGQAVFMPSSGSKISIIENIIRNSNIDLSLITYPGDGITPNDVGDVDSGPNDLMNYPTVSIVNYLGSDQFFIKGYLDANIAEAPYSIEICESDNHISGHGGCIQTLDTFTLNTPGAWTRTVNLNGATGNETFTALATNDNGSTSEFGMFQLADADPEFNGSDWIITVDTTSDEDNVGTTGFDDGDGIYSGGGLSGPSGSANGLTSLREAIIVANNFAQPVRIEFNIPATDSGYRDLDDPDTNSSGDSLDNDDFWKIEPLTGLPSIFDDITIDGESQEVNQGDNYLEILTTNYLDVDSNTTIGPDIIIDFQSVPAASLQIRGNNITIQKIGITGSTSSQRSTNVGTSSDVTFDQVEWFDNDGNALEIYNSNSGTMIISNSLFRANGPDNDETITATSADVLQIIDNIFYNNSSISLFVQENVAQSTIENNFFIDNSIDSPAPQIWFYGASNALVNNNFFYNNQDKGLVVSASPTPSGITIGNNLFDDNLGIAIDLDGGIQDSNGITVNDSDDSDMGPNELMNYPTIESVTYLGGGAYKVEGDLDGNGTEGPFTIELCESDSHSSGYGGCVQTLAVEPASSSWEVVVTFPGDDGTENRSFTALATNINGSTSEFSENFIATDTNPDYIIEDYPVDLVSPGNTQEILNTNPILTWEANDDPDIDKYEIYFGDSESNMVKIGEVDAIILEFQVNNLELKQYYWQVVGIRANNTVGGVSPIFTFTVTEEEEEPTPTPLPEPIPDSYPVNPKPNNQNNKPPVSYPVSAPVSYPTPPDYIDTPDIDDVPVSGEGVDTNADIKEGNGLLSTILISIIFSLILLVLSILKRTGRVIDIKSHEGIPGAMIQVFDINSNLIKSTYTDEDGYFRLSLLRGNDYHIFITHDSYKVLEIKYKPNIFKTIHEVFKMTNKNEA